jgi:hypothetical protein
MVVREPAVSCTRKAAEGEQGGQGMAGGRAGP